MAARLSITDEHQHLPGIHCNCYISLIAAISTLEKKPALVESMAQAFYQVQQWYDIVTSCGRGRKRRWPRIEPQTRFWGSVWAPKTQSAADPFLGDSAVEALLQTHALISLADSMGHNSGSGGVGTLERGQHQNLLQVICTPTPPRLESL